MRPPSTGRLVFIVGTLAVLAGIIGIIQGSTAANNVPPTFAGMRTVSFNLDQIAPPECYGMGLTNLVWGVGNVGGTNRGDLLLGSPHPDALEGQQGGDCLVGGAGSDTLRGGPGRDVCIGSALAKFQQCEVTIVR